MLAEFFARNGRSWRIDSSSFSASLGVLKSVLESTDGDNKTPIVSLTDDEVLKIAIDFVVTNYDLFGQIRGRPHACRNEPSDQRKHRPHGAQNAHFLRNGLQEMRTPASFAPFS